MVRKLQAGGMLSRQAIQTARPSSKKVLIVEDDEDVARANQRALERYGWSVVVASDVSTAADLLVGDGSTVVLCDINLPGKTGVDLLDIVRLRDIDVPVILLTGAPSIQSAIDAVSLGAAEYLVKPIEPERLNARLERVWELLRVRQTRTTPAQVRARSELAERFARALDGLHLVFQPIFDLRTRVPMAYEALMRSSAPDLPNPLAILDAAEKLNRLQDLGRRVRELADEAFELVPEDALLFVNLHASDLLDPKLHDDSSPLSRWGTRVVLEVTERASMDGLGDTRSIVGGLRSLGYRVAIDDLGAGYAGLTSFALLEPEIVKLDMSLVRNIHLQTTHQYVVDSMVKLCRGLGVRIVAEGIETAAELAVICDLGCDLGQGYGLGRPARDFSIPPFPALR